MSYQYEGSLDELRAHPACFEPNSVNIDVLVKAFNARDGISVFLFDSNRNISGELAILSRGRFGEKKLYSSILKVVSARAGAELHRYKAEEELKAYRDSLEDLVDQRTSELKKYNEKLASEIEKRKEIERNLRVAKTQAEEATKAKSVFLATMSHEIRTPMNGILGVASLLERLPLSDKIRNYVELIKVSGNNLLHIINDILDISKLESGRVKIEKTSFDFKELLKNVCEVHYSTAKDKGVNLFLNYPKVCPGVIMSDQVRLRQVVENVVSNAIKFTDRGHVIVSVSIDSTAGLLKVAVEDTGIGLSKEQSDLVFEQFAQADTSTTRRFGGTGLGLSICRKIMALLGGEIDCQSNIGEGAIFTFWLPIEIPKQEAASHTLDPAGKEEPKGHIFLAHRHERLSEVMATLLKEHGYSVTILKPEMRDLEQVQETCYLIGDGFQEEWVPMEQFFGKGELLVPGDNLRYPETIRYTVVDAPYWIEGYLAKITGVGRGVETEEDQSDFSVGLFKAVNILVAEDNPINRVVAVDLLESMGAKVDVADDGEFAVRLYENKRYDLVLMDCLMPKMDGFEALSVIKSSKSPMAGPKPPVVALTANAMKGDREKCLAAGFDEYISKPLRVDDLVRVRGLLGASAR